ncbi:MAG: glycosyltransferase family 1 protein [Candidatus Spechtbacterales bacterium]|nr:glycosyltransferase family 1 protein [Candidatus Spechtbacterales bacterium]
MIKVAIDCHKLEDATGAHRAGIGRHIYKLLEEISKKPELAEKFRFYLYFKGHIPKDIEFLNNEIFVKKVAKLPLFLPFFRPSFNIFFHIALPIYTLKDRVDVIFFSSFMYPAFYMGKSILLLTNDVYYEFTKGTLPFKYRISYKLFAKWGAIRATQITTQTNASRDEISGYFNIAPEKIEVVPLGADLKDFAPKEKVQKENYIFYVGQAFPRRHLKETLQAFELIAYDFPELNFIAVGIDKYNPPVIEGLVKKINQKLGNRRIYRQEFVSDEGLVEFYQKAKIFTYISSSEAMGLPPLEALAAGTVPVVADTPTTKEIFGSHAFFVEDSEDPKNIAKVLREALQNAGARDKILQDREEVLAKYTWKGHAEKMIEMFEKVSLK